MKAYNYHGETRFSMDEVPIPKACKGEAVAKILCASICGTDLRTYRFGSAKLKTPITVGHEACYEIDLTPIGCPVFKLVGLPLTFPRKLVGS